MVAAVQENQGATVNYTLTHDIFYGAGPTAYSFRFVFFFFLTSNVELHEVMFHQKQSCITDSVQCIFFFFFLSRVCYGQLERREIQLGRLALVLTHCLAAHYSLKVFNSLLKGFFFSPYLHISSPWADRVSLTVKTNLLFTQLHLFSPITP